MLDFYSNELEKLRELGREFQLTEDELNEIFDESFTLLEKEKTQRKRESRLSRLITVFICSLGILIVIYFGSLYIRTISNYFLERSVVQELFYPLMKTLRSLVLPFITAFPSLTEWYDETCLVSNPYFQTSDIDCWPCESVLTILNLTDAGLTGDSGVPFITKEKSLKSVSLKSLRLMFENQKEMFKRDAPHVESNMWERAEDMFRGKFRSKEGNSHAIWKLNRLEPTREARALFGVPTNVPDYVSGATPEKYIILDEPSSPTYSLCGSAGGIGEPEVDHLSIVSTLK